MTHETHSKTCRLRGSLRPPGVLSESVFGPRGPSPSVQITEQKGGGGFSHSSLQATEAPVSQETLLVREEIKGGLLKTHKPRDFDIQFFH